MCDATDYAVGAVLWQIKKKNHSIYDASKVLNKSSELCNNRNRIPSSSICIRYISFIISKVSYCFH